MSEKRKDKKGRLLQQNERQRADGVYEYRYTDRNGDKHSVYSWKLVPTDKVPKGKRDGKLSLREMELQIRKQIFENVNPYSVATVTLNQCYDSFFESKAGIKRKSRDQYTWLYSKIGPRIGNAKASEITRNGVKKFYLELLDDGASIETVAKVDMALDQIFDNAIDNRILNYNPCNGVIQELKRELRYSKGKKLSLTLAQQKAFLEFTEHDPKHAHWYPFFKFMLGTGCRVGEALGLTWNDIDFENNLISINHAVCYYKRGGSDEYGFEVTRPKTDAGCRVIPMLDEVRNMLAKLRDRQERMILPDIKIDGLSGFVWRTRSGSLPIPGTVNAALYSIQKDYNALEEMAAELENRQPLLLPKFSVHVLRHTFCTRLCENESNTKVIQEVMGHTSIVTTMNIYNNATDDLKKNVFAGLNGKIL